MQRPDHHLIEKQTEKIIRFFSCMIETKNEYTLAHSHHVCVIVGKICELLPADYRVDSVALQTAALLHDLGKIHTPDEILNKAGALTEEEMEIVRRHPADGKALLQETPFQPFGDWILYHHERMDGKGYYGLQGDAIPLESRIIAIADVFSALRTYRIYRPAKGINETIEILRAGRGGQFDAQILDAFLALDKDVLANLECNCEICRRRREALEKNVQCKVSP